MSFARRELPAARAFVDSVYSAGGARVGRGSRHPSTWSDDYTLRIANVWQRQAAAGRPLSLQEARRGPGFTAKVLREQEAAMSHGRMLRGGLEHPRLRWVGPRTGTGRPDTEESVGFYAKQYRRTGKPARRFIERLGTERVQIIGYGPILAGYSGRADPVAEDETISYVYRVMFTGYVEVLDDDAWDAMADGFHLDENGTPDKAMFDTEDGEQIRLEIRFGPGIGD